MTLILTLVAIISHRNTETDTTKSDREDIIIGSSQGIQNVIQCVMAKQKDYTLRAKKNYRERHADKLKEYARKYYLEVTLAKRRAKSALKESHQDA